MEFVKIAEICQISNGYAFKSGKYVDNNGARIIRITNVQKGEIVDNDPKFYPFNLLDSLDNYKILEGDILMSLTGNVGRVGKFPKELLPAYINQRICRVMPKDNSLDVNYLFHYLNSNIFEKEAIRNSAGAAQLNLSTKWLENHLIPLPSLEEQKAIAARLDKADQIRQLNQQIINHYDELIQALFIDMFGDPMKNEMRWQENELDNVCIKITDGEHTTPKRELKGIYLLSARNVRNGFIDLSAGVDYIGDEEYNRISKRCSPEKNDILMSCSGSVGRVSIVNVDYKFSLVRSVALIKPKSNLINSIYLNNYMLTLYFQHQILKYSKKSSQSNIFLGSIKKLKVHLPPLELQNQFAERVQKIEAQKELAEQALQQSEDLFNSLLQQAFKK